MKDLLCGIAIGYVLFTEKGHSFSTNLGNQVKGLLSYEPKKGGIENTGEGKFRLPEKSESAKTEKASSGNSLPSEKAS